MTKILFNQTKYTREERILNGLQELVLTQGGMLVVFIIVFSYYLNPESSVSELIENGMVKDPSTIQNPLFQVYRNNTPIILAILFGLPSLILVALKIRHKIQRQDQERKNIT